MNFLQRVLAGFVFGAAALAFAWPASTPSKPAPSIAAISSTELEERWMVEGEKRYRANCGRCHQPPHKFPPRTMAMAIRHMRVRAMLTEDDMKYVLYYMTH
jgi:mono/diheme cytochrome c family protein